MHKSSYLLQDRGNQTSYNQYLAAMDAVSVEKVASASVFFDPAPGNTIVDVGMASGSSSNILALLFPDVNIVGVDINPNMVDIAAQTYQQSNLRFRLDDGETLLTFEPGSISGFFNCSAIHHITSFNGYDSNRAYNAIKRQASLLQSGGIIVVRDFVKPPEMEVILEVSNQPLSDRPSDAELLLSFSRTARSLSNPSESGFPIKEISSQSKTNRKFRLHYADAVEFIRRKDYYENWEIELQEEYGYFTQLEFEEVFASLGLRIIVSNPIYNPWIIKNRYRRKFALYDTKLNDLGFPPTNYLIAGEKVIKKGTRLSLVRHLPESQDPFLKFSFFKDTAGQKTYDVVQRPNSVADIIPFYLNENRLLIIAKHGYPRPLANICTDSPVIDRKHFSGYITEGITASYPQSLETILAERANIRPNQILSTEKLLEYFTSPGGIDEKVDSYLIQLRELSSVDNTPCKSYSGFCDSGSLRIYDAIQLLKTAQTGALVEARLELNLYNLLRKLNIRFPAWLGETITVDEREPSLIKTIPELRDIGGQNFVPSPQSAGYLQKHRAKFIEDGIIESSNILEFITPENLSVNTLVTLPVTRFKNEVYVGLELRHLPVPQIHTGNSALLTVPAFRLSKSCSTFKELENYVSELTILGSPVKSYNKLGEKYFPSLGVTPEQVYPYVVTLAGAGSNLQWVNLTELYQNLEIVKDGHLLVAIMRLVHATQSD